MVIVIIYILDSYTDGFYGYYSAIPARCGTSYKRNRKKDILVRA